MKGPLTAERRAPYPAVSAPVTQCPARCDTAEGVKQMANPQASSMSGSPPTDEPLGNIIRLFVSSTFADFAFEREVLQRRVFPRLRALCAAQDCRFQPIDLRWGVT